MPLSCSLLAYLTRVCALCVCVCVSPAAEAGGRFWEARDICPCRGMIHPHLGRSCWFLVGQVARGR
eukprot:scaffold55162_cov60-Phaeocystis_antarctica.AAC.1